MKYTILFILTLFIFISCKQEFASKEIEKSYNSVMHVHDEVMPELNTIHHLRKKLKPYKKSNEEVLNLMDNLEKADDGMMIWMREFDLDKSATESMQLDYLNDEQTKINKVSEDMKSSIANAQEFLNVIKEAQ